MSYTKWSPLSPNGAAVLALLLAAPIALLAIGIVFDIRSIESALKSVLTSDGETPNVLGRIYMIAGLLALPVALLVSVWPMLRKGVDGKRRFYVLNAAAAVLVIALMTPTWGGLAKDIYRCDILQIPNCD
jgi:hypothetical protein